jgi:hypothetical protein
VHVDNSQGKKRVTVQVTKDAPDTATPQGQ